MNYIEILKDLMKEKNLSQNDIAIKIKVNQTTVSQWLLGKKKPSFDNILAIYQEFGITPNEFFGVDK